MPEGDLDIEIVYTLDGNEFTDILDLLISPARTLTTLGIEIYGVSLLLNPIRGEYALFSDTIPFGDPRNVGTLFTETTTLGGFEDVPGSRFSFANQSGSSPGTVAVAEPQSLALLGAGLLGVAWSAHRRSTRRHAAYGDLASAG